jgi:hypothetical protein
MNSNQTPLDPAAVEHIQLHRDGTLWARGWMSGEVQTGYWEWFRKDGTRLRSGHFIGGKQVGEWTTYDREGQVYKVTVMGQRAARVPEASKVSK